MEHHLTPALWFQYIVATGAGLATCGAIVGLCAVVYVFVAGYYALKKRS